VGTIREKCGPPGSCPVCGADVPAQASACPECGSDERTGWSEEARYDGLDLPGRDFDYDEFVSRELGRETRRARHHTARWIVALVMLVLIVWVLLASSW